MELTAQIHANGTPQQVLGALADREFIAFATERAGMRLVSTDIEQLDSGAITLVVRRAATSDLIPANFRSFVGSDIELRQTEAWAESIPEGATTRHGTFDIEIVGAPVRIAGRSTIAEESGQSVLRYEGEVKASIPLFGATIEKAVGQVVEQVLASQSNLVNEWLARG